MAGLSLCWRSLSVPVETTATGRGRVHGQCIAACHSAGMSMAVNTHPLRLPFYCYNRSMTDDVLYQLILALLRGHSTTTLATQSIGSHWHCSKQFIGRWGVWLCRLETQQWFAPGSRPHMELLPIPLPMSYTPHHAPAPYIPRRLLTPATRVAFHAASRSFAPVLFQATFPANGSPAAATNAAISFASLQQLITQCSWVMHRGGGGGADARPRL